MKSVKLGLLIIFLFGSTHIGVAQIQPQSKSSQTKFTINRECDGGACHFQIISFNYGRNSSIAVGLGDSSLSYYFSVQITNGKTSKDYIYSDEPEEHFIEKESKQKVEATLNSLLLNVYKLGNYIFENDVDTRNKTFSETGRFAVLANLRNRTNSTVTTTSKPKKTSVSSHIDSEYQTVLQKWLVGKPGWRPATKQDAYIGVSKDAYDFVESQMQDLNHHPYYVVADFNGDGNQDFALVLIKKVGRNYKYAVAIFNGLFSKNQKIVPTFYTEQIDIGDWLFWMEGNEFGNRFVVGPPASDSGYIIRARKKKYIIE